MPHAYTNGIVTFYEDAGNGPPVVLIHGHSVDLRLWDAQAPALVAAGYRVIRYDIRGHGRSLVPPDGYTWENYTQDLADLLDRVNVERPATEPLALGRVHLVGLSMGGAIALRFAIEHPQRVITLTLVDSALPGFAYGDEINRAVQELQEAMQSGGPEAFRRAWLQHPLFDGVRTRPGAWRAIEEMVAGFQAPEYRGAATAPEGYQPPETIERLAEICCPTLVVTGEHDLPDFQYIAEILAAGIPGARRVVMPGCGHIPPMEEPEAFNRLLLSFLGEHGAEGSGGRVA